MMILSEATHEESIMPDGAVRAIITEGELTNELLEYPDGRRLSQRYWAFFLVFRQVLLRLV